MCSKTLFCVRNYTCSSAYTFVTTPIYYVNASPHIGHLYSSVIADAVQRWQQVRHRNVKIKLSTGTDEHGSKIQQAAKYAKSSLSGYCNNISMQYRDLAHTFDIQYTDFIRTSEEPHKNTVQQFWKCLDTKGHIYKSSYKGWYCISDETFLSNSQLKEISKDGQTVLVSADSGHPVEWSEEPNYIFKLSSIKDDLIYWLTKNEAVVRPKKFQKILLDLIHTEDALSDISISRPSARVHWGIPVPNDETQTIYVWLDALVNYLTAAEYMQHSDKEFKKIWPPSVQVIGKDILKFHGVYWPAFLIAAGLEPPSNILCHSHWTVDGQKMSKSKGNVVDPMERSKLYSTDGLRYFLLREGVNHSDGNYSDTKMLRVLNSELADTLGNLLSRCCGKALNPEQTFPRIQPNVFQRIALVDVTKKLVENLEALPDICDTHYNEFNFYKVADSVIATLHLANLFFETLKPWELKRSASTIEELRVVLHLALESLRVCGILLQPLIPNITNSLLDKLSIPKDQRSFYNSKQFSWKNVNFSDVPLSSEKAVLFKRILTEELSKNKVQKG